MNLSEAFKQGKAFAAGGKRFFLLRTAKDGWQSWVQEEHHRLKSARSCLFSVQDLGDEPVQVAHLPRRLKAFNAVCRVLATGSPLAIPTLSLADPAKRKTYLALAEVDLADGSEMALVVVNHAGSIWPASEVDLCAQIFAEPESGDDLARELTWAVPK